MKLNNVDGFSFDFTDAIDAFIFDRGYQDPKSQMKGVDIIVEMSNFYVFVEIKDHSAVENKYDIINIENDDDSKEKRAAFKWLKDYLKYKLRDTFLYRHLEDKMDKPVRYVCLLIFDNALNSIIQKQLRHELPIKKYSPDCWQRPLVERCDVVNLERWNSVFPNWPAEKV